VFYFILRGWLSKYAQFDFRPGAPESGESVVLSLNYQASDALNGLELPYAIDGDLEPVTHSDVIEDARHNPASETV
jgi:hypothetical protein